MITLIGMGSGTPESLTAQGLAALQNAGLILGAKRLLEQLPQGCTEHRKALYQPEDVLAALAADPEVDAALVYSGDTGFYSGAPLYTRAASTSGSAASAARTSSG